MYLLVDACSLLLIGPDSDVAIDLCCWEFFVGLGFILTLSLELSSQVSFFYMK